MGSLSKRLTLIIIVLATCPLLVLGALISWQTYRVQKSQAILLEKETAIRVVIEVDRFVQGLVDELETTVLAMGQGEKKLSSYKMFIANILSRHSYYDRIILADSKGREIVHQSRLDLVTADQLKTVSDLPEFLNPMATGSVYFGPVVFNPFTGEPSMIISIPLINPSSGFATGTLIAHTRWKKIWLLFSAMEQRPGEDIYLLDRNGRLVAHRNPSLVLRNTTYNPRPLSGIDLGFQGVKVIRAVKKLTFGDQSFTVVAEQSLREAFSLAINTMLITSALIVILLIIAVTLIILAVRIIIQPIKRLAETAREIEAGHLEVQVEVRQHDEIGDLAQAFNKMTAKLRQTLAYLKQEVAEHERDLQSLQLSEQRFRQLAENIQEVFWVVSPDWEEVYYVSPAYEQLWGRSRKSLYENALSWVDAIVEEDRSLVSAFIDSNCSRDFDSLLFPEYRVTRSDGSYRWISSRGFPVRNKSGKVFRVAGISEDITVRKESEEKLLAQQYLLQNAQKIGKIGTWELDATNNKLVWTDETYKIFGLPVGTELNYEIFINCVHPEDRLFVDSEWKEALEGKPYDIEHRILVDGKSKWVREKAKLEFSENGECFSGIGFVQDITKQKSLLKKLSQAQKMESIGNLAGGIAHDFNNILSSIIGFTELALDDVDKDSLIEDNLQEVYTAGKRAKGLVAQILAFARQSEEEMKPIQVDSIVKEVLQFIRSSIPTNIEIKQNIDSDSLIMGNQTQVHQIMMNLCTNAAYAMEDNGGTLDVTLKDIVIEKSIRKKLDLKPGNFIKLTISDPGTGIPPNIIDSIFEPYFTTKDPGEGTGMGLAMVQGIIESYGGKIAVKSVLTEGTTFTIYFPVTRKRKIQRQYEPEELPKGTERILFVDDEAPIAKMGSQGLERLGYQVTTRTSSVEALELFRSKSNEFDLVITDMTMPNMTGDRLAIELMKIKPDIPVILCTGYSKRISDETASEIGIKAFAYKPVVKADLAKTVRKVLDEAKG